MSRLMVKTFLISQEKMILKHMKILEKLPLVKQRITQLVVCYITLTLKKIIK